MSIDQTATPHADLGLRAVTDPTVERAGREEEHGCGCGGACGGGGASSTPEPGDLDARAIPRHVRRPALIAAVGALPPGAPLVIAADHDPAHLSALLTAELGRQVTMSYLQQGPDLWRVRVVVDAG